MAELEGDVGLNISEALSAVDQLASTAQEAITQALEASAAAFSQAISEATTQIQGELAETLSDIPISVDASEVPTEIDAAVSSVEATLPVEADVSGAQESVDELVSEVDGTDAEISVSADTSEAQGALDDLSESADGLSASTESASKSSAGLANSAGLVGGSAALASGEIGGLATAAEGVGGRVAFAAGAIGALAVGTGIFFNEAVDALGATQRFESSLGDMANRVENLRDINGLNTDLSELALTLGSDDDKIRSVAARLFELASASGVAEDGAALYVEQLIAMGARAVALNPELGDVGDVTDRLSTAFFRGGKIAAQFGIDLSTGEIQTRALKDSGKELASELTFVDRSMAGAALASEKYGANLDQVVAEGSKNATTEQRRFKQSIVEIAEEIGKPLVAPIFALFDGSKATVKALGEALGELAQAALPLVKSGLETLVPLVQIASEAITALTDITGALGINATASGAAIGFMVAGPVGALAGGLIGLASDLGVFGDAEQDAAEQTSHLARQIERLDATGALAAFNKQVDSVIQHSVDIGVPAERLDRLLVTLRQFRLLAQDDAGAAARVLAGLDPASTKAAQFAVALNQVTANQRRATAATVDAARAETLLTGSYEDQIKVLGEKADALLASYDATFAAIHADEAARDAVDRLNTAYDEEIKASGDVEKATEAQNRALVTAEEDILRAAAAAGEKAAKDHEAEGAAASHAAKIDAQITELHKFIDTLAPDSPLRQFLEQYIARLGAIPAEKATTITIRSDQALIAIEDVSRALRGIGAEVGELQLSGLGQTPRTSAKGGVLTGADAEAGTYVGEEGIEFVRGLPGGGFEVVPNGRIAGVPSPVGQVVLPRAQQTMSVELNVDVRVDAKTGEATTTVTDPAGNILAVQKSKVEGIVRAL